MTFYVLHPDGKWSGAFGTEQVARVGAPDGCIIVVAVGDERPVSKPTRDFVTAQRKTVLRALNKVRHDPNKKTSTARLVAALSGGFRIRASILREAEVILAGASATALQGGE